MKLETNTAFVERIMEHCPHGALIQAMVIEALTKYSTAFAKDENRLPKTGLIHPDAWQQCAKWLNEKLEEKYGKC